MGAYDIDFYDILNCYDMSDADWQLCDKALRKGLLVKELDDIVNRIYGQLLTMEDTIEIHLYETTGISGKWKGWARVSGNDSFYLYGFTEQLNKCFKKAEDKAAVLQFACDLLIAALESEGAFLVSSNFDESYCSGYTIRFETSR